MNTAELTAVAEERFETERIRLESAGLVRHGAIEKHSWMLGFAVGMEWAFQFLKEVNRD